MRSFSQLTFLLLSTYTALNLAANPDNITIALSNRNPVIPTNFPDPGLAFSNLTQTYYAFSTQSGLINIQLASSHDFTNWTLHEGYDALPNPGPWANNPPHAAVWAPDVHQRPDGSWIMYYAAAHGKQYTRRHCIGAALAPTIEGPYTPHSEPLVCDLAHGGNIDPNLFLDPATGFAHLVYKTDGNTLGHGGACGNAVNPIVPTPLYMQRLDPRDLLTKIGEPVFLFSNDGPLDGPNVERPCMTAQRGTYFLLYNSRCFDTEEYKVRYVSCVNARDVTGCDWRALKGEQEQWRKPLLETGMMGLHAPGSVDVDGKGRMVFHADVHLEWFADESGGNDDGGDGDEEQVKRKPVKRDRAMFAAQMDLHPATGDLSVLGLYQ